MTEPCRMGSADQVRPWGWVARSSITASPLEKWAGSRRASAATSSSLAICPNTPSREATRDAESSLWDLPEGAAESLSDSAEELADTAEKSQPDTTTVRHRDLKSHLYLSEKDLQ